MESDIDPAIVISERNYLQLDRRNKDLYANFYNEMFAARCVVIVGNSVKDLEIAQGILSRSSALKEKTFIICHPSDKGFARSRIEKFGTVLPIGVDGICSALSDLSHFPRPHVGAFQFLEEVTLGGHAAHINGDDFVKLILRAELDTLKLRRQFSDRDGDSICVERRGAIATILDGTDLFIRRFIVSSDFGKGKTIFLHQLAVQAIERGYRVLLVKTQLHEAFVEVDTAIASGERFIFILDDVVRYREMAKYVGARTNNNIALVCTTRGEQDDRSYVNLASELGG